MSGNSLSRIWNRLKASPAEFAEPTQTKKTDLDAIGACSDRQRVRLRGTITSVTLAPRKGAPWLDVVLDDGSGRVNLVWMGRHGIPGVSVGKQIVVEGRVSCVDGERRIYNPKYELIAA